MLAVGYWTDVKQLAEALAIVLWLDCKMLAEALAIVHWIDGKLLAEAFAIVVIVHWLDGKMLAEALAIVHWTDSEHPLMWLLETSLETGLVPALITYVALMPNAWEEIIAHPLLHQTTFSRVMNSAVDDVPVEKVLYDELAS